MPRKPKPEPGSSQAPAEASDAPAGEDKRRQPRFDSAQRLWCEGQPDPSALLALNMSLGGMFIAGDDAQVGQRLRVSFCDEGEAICLDLEVLWKGTARAGGPEGAGTRIVGFSRGRDVYDRFVQRELQHRDHGAGEASEAVADTPEERSRSQPP